MSDDDLSLGFALARGGFHLTVEEALPLQGVTAVFGPSGGGKTTLLRVVAGFEHPERGRIVMAGETWVDTDAGIARPAHLRGVGTVFQDTRLFGHLDVAGNLDYADRRARDLPGPERGAVIAALDLGALLHRRAQDLSGGERQRVALGRALLSRPRLLLLDEPLSALDTARKREILPYLETVFARFEIPALYVSHDIDEVARLAGRMLVLSGGKVEACGPVDEVMERLDLEGPSGVYEPGALIEGRVRSHDRRLHLTRLDVGGAQIALPGLDATPVGSTVRLAVRARDVALAVTRPDGISIRNVLPGTVLEISGDPGQAHADVWVETCGTRLRARLTRAAVEDLSLTPGTPVFVLIKSISLDRT